MFASGEEFGRAGVAAIYCVHGTFSGNDALGLLTELARFTPELSESLRRIGKRAVDLIAGETGNYTPRYAATMQTTLSDGAKRTIPVRLFNWSSQNNHIGRADGAVRLLNELARISTKFFENNREGESRPRVILWGHSHAGNVFSLMSNLLGADASARTEFFKAAQMFFHPWLRRKVDMPVWSQVQQLLDDTDHPLRKVELDIVTFGTPIRYGWDTGGYANLLHLIHHRPVEGIAEYLAPQSIRFRRLFSAAEGDYIQQLGIAGTNLVPNPLAPRTLQADWRLGTFLERGMKRESIFNRIRYGTRVPDEGNTLLVDYKKIEPCITNHLAGHAVYTRSRWLPFHCEQVAKAFYRA